MRASARELLKAAARVVAHIAAVPSVVSFAIRAPILGPDRALQNSTQMLGLVPGLAGQYLRRAFLQRTIAGCHKSVVVEFGTTLSRTGARLDEGAYIGPGCHLGLVHIERDVLMASGVHVPSGQRTHGFGDVSSPIRDQSGEEQLVSIGAGSWIGEAAVVMASVGAQSIVGAGAVVTRPLPPLVVAAGVPARVLRSRVVPERTCPEGSCPSRGLGTILRPSKDRSAV